MILKSTNFGSVKIKHFKDLRDALEEKRHISSANSLKITGLPSWLNKQYKVKGESVNPAAVTCSCKEFKKNSELYPAKDTRLVCKHLYWLISQKANKYMDILILKVLENQYKFGLQHIFIAGLAAREIVVSLNQSSPWLSFFAWQEELLLKYSYNLEDSRWSYNNIPENPEDLLYIYETLIID